MLGTAGSIYHFRDIITNGKPDAFFLMYSDAFCDFPLHEMIQFKEKFMPYVMMTVKVVLLSCLFKIAPQRSDNYKGSFKLFLLLFSQQLLYLRFF